MTLPDFFVAEMQSLSAADSGLRRAAIVPEAARDEGFEAAYDWTTLWYDALAGDGLLRLVCPKLLNFKTFLADGALRLDGQPARIRRVRRHRRHDIVEIPAPGPVTEVTTRAGRWQGRSGVSPDQSAHFAGLNASLHISRNNRLDWIADWARFHIAEHGLEAMLVMDNGSDDYPPEALAETLAAAGLKRGVVLKVPQPYGPVRSRAGGGGAKFLQPAMLNLARLRFLSRARAVLNVDIDELVWSRGGSVFDAARGHPLGLVLFDGEWRYPGPDAPEPARHADHLFIRPDARPCPTKYCIRPEGWLRGISWDVHKPEVALPTALLKRRDLGYWHCRNISTNWKSYDRLKRRAPGPRDAFAAQTLARALPRD